MQGGHDLSARVTEGELSRSEVVRSYKGLEQAERAFKTFKGPELEIRPIHHLEHRVSRPHLPMHAALIPTWHLKRAWAPLLFKDE